MSGDIDETDDIELQDDLASDDADDDSVDNVGDLSVEIDVSELVADIELSDAEEAERKQAVRRRLEELNEAKEKELDSTYNISLDDD